MSAMPADNKDREMKFHFWGWILFVVCAGFFIGASIENGDVLSLCGGIIFLIACVVFLIPILRKRNRDEPELTNREN